MTRREFLKTTAAAVAFSAIGMDALGATTKKPNLLFIFSDMQRANTLGCYGVAEAITPRLDALAREGARFDAGISNTPVCCPYRACLMSGRISSTIRHRRTLLHSSTRGFRKSWPKPARHGKSPARRVT